MPPSLTVGKEAFLRTGELVYLVEILGVARNAIWISFPDTAPPAPGTGVELDIDEGDSFTRYHAHVSASTPDSPGIMLERSESSRYAKQRSEFRVSYDTNITIVHAATRAASVARIVDVSASGARVASNETFAVGDHLVLAIEWPNDFDFEYPVRVVYARPPRRFHHTFGYGVRFGAVDQEARAALTRFLSREISRRYPEELLALYPRSKRRKPRRG